MSFVFDPPERPRLDVVGGGEFPVRRIFCVGRNYAEHAREMGGDPAGEAPFFFTKPADAIVASGSTIPYPSHTGDLHHEIELVVALGKGGTDINAGDANAHVFGYAVGLDLTRRDLQSELRKAGRPWDMAKGFDRSAPCTPIQRKETVGTMERGRISLSVNGKPRQMGDLSDLIWSVPEIIQILSTYVALAPGDLIYTGTPAGVAAVQKGDRLVGHIDGLPALEIAIAN